MTIGTILIGETHNWTHRNSLSLGVESLSLNNGNATSIENLTRSKVTVVTTKNGNRVSNTRITLGVEDESRVLPIMQCEAILNAG